MGDGDLVAKALESCRYQLEQRYQYQARGYDFDRLVSQMATLSCLEPEIMTRRGCYPDTVLPSSVVCYLTAQDLGISTLELAKRLGVSQPTVSQSVKRWERSSKKRNSN